MAEDVQGTPATPGGNASVSALTPGQRVGASRYTLLHQLGQGGMGTVWLARDEQLGEEVALKFLLREITHDADALEDLRRETLKSRKLTHPNIIRIHDLHQAPGEAPFISMEFIQGTPLSVLKSQQPQRLFPWTFVQPLVRQLCEALEYAHKQKVIHRDLKPANMMVNAEGELKLADFGIAATASDSLSRLTGHVGSSGTPAYMSPQQMNSQAPRVTDDVYALGATLYELLTSKPPFYGGDVYRQVQDKPATPLDQRLADLELSNEIPADVAALIMACLAKEPAQRPQSAGAVAEWIGITVGPQSTGQLLARAGAVQPQPENGVTEEVMAEAEEPEAEAVEDEPQAPAAMNRRAWWVGLSLAALMLVVFAAWLLLGRAGKIRKTASTQTPAEQPGSVSTNPVGEAMRSSSATSAAWIPLDISAACNADVISTAARKAADQLTFNGGTLASASWLRMKSYPQPGVPDDGRVPIPDTTPPGFFQVRVPPGRNAMLLSSPQGRFPQPVTVELTASDRRRFSELAILHATCWGNGTLRVLLHYETGEDTTVSIPLCDWFADGRTSLPAGLRVAVTSHDTHPTGGKPAEILAQRIPADPQRTLRSLTFSFGSLAPPKGYAEQDARSRFTIGIFAVGALPATASVGALPATASVSASTDTAWENAINLLPLIDLKKDVVAGSWTIQNGALIGDNDMFARIELPYRPPAEYDFLVEFKQLRKGLGGCQHLAKAGRNFTWNFFGAKEQLFAFEMVANQNMQGNPTTTRIMPIEQDRTYVSLVQVRKDRVSGSIDGKLVASWKTDYTDLDAHEKWKLRDVSLLGIGSQSRLAFSRVAVREITGKGTFTRAGPRASADPVPATSAPDAKTPGDGFVSLFNGRDLTGWTGNPKIWSVQNGAITGTGTRANAIAKNTFLIWLGGTVDDFELRLSFKITAGNSGVQYRSKVLDPANWVVGGYQFEIDAEKPATVGMLFDERGTRSIMAGAGEKVVFSSSGKKTVSKLDSPAATCRPNDWNTLTITAQGNRLIHQLNGVSVAELTDGETTKAARTGVLALQVHKGNNLKVQFKDIQLKRLTASASNR